MYAYVKMGTERSIRAKPFEIPFPLIWLLFNSVKHRLQLTFNAQMKKASVNQIIV